MNNEYPAILNWSECQPEIGDYDPALAAVAIQLINNDIEQSSNKENNNGS